MANEAPELSKVQPPGGTYSGATSNNPNQQPAPRVTINSFPKGEDLGRLRDYEYYERLFLGRHFEAFRILVADERYNREQALLRYIAVNFAGLISKIIADFLFSEPIVVKAQDGDQDFIDAFWQANQMDVQCYESALSNSYMGDAVFKLRVGKRSAQDKSSTVIAEDITPSIYFPIIDGFNVRAEPEAKELAWTFKKDGKDYLRKEIHKPGLIENKVYEMKNNEIQGEVDLSILGNIPGLVPATLTGIERSLVIHVPNWKTGNRHFGLSDYHDLDTLFYAINNRMTKTDNILDKHSDPILMVPPGILDEKGRVKKKALGVIEIGPGEENNKPEYIVWDASLENAFKEIEKLVEFIYMVGEVSPDVLGLGEGVSDSGRALKFKLMRTIAKAARKKLYYDRAIKEVVYVAQLLAKEHKLEIDGVALKGEPVRPEIEWADGIPVDMSEQLDIETKAIDIGITSKKDAIMRVYEMDEEAAELELKQIEDEKPKVEMPLMKIGQNDKVVDPKTGKPPVMPPMK